MSGEIDCTACGQTALIRREAQYEGFRKVGESLICTNCGHRYDATTVPPPRATGHRPELFTEADKPDPVRLFESDERGRTCRTCRHFVLHPFTQRCGKNNHVTQATDLCFDFEADA